MKIDVNFIDFGFNVALVEIYVLRQVGSLALNAILSLCCFVFFNFNIACVFRQSLLSCEDFSS